MAMFHIDRAFRAQGRQVGAADVCMQRSERLSENGFIRRAAPRGRTRQAHGAELTATRRRTRNGTRAVLEWPCLVSLVSSEGLRPSDSPTRSRAPLRRRAPMRGSLAVLARVVKRTAGLWTASSLIRGSPLGYPDTRSRAPRRRRASASARSATARPRRSLGVGGPFAWLARGARSRRETNGRFMRRLLVSSEGFAPRIPRHAPSRAASPPRFRLRAKRYGETSPKPWRRRAVRVARSRCSLAS